VTGAAAGSVRSAGAGDSSGAAAGGAFSAARATRADKNKNSKADNPTAPDPKQRLNFRLRVNGDTFGNDDSRRKTVSGSKRHRMSMRDGSTPDGCELKPFSAVVIASVPSNLIERPLQFVRHPLAKTISPAGLALRVWPHSAPVFQSHKKTIPGL
jgi:hypothetical protein